MPHTRYEQTCFNLARVFFCVYYYNQHNPHAFIWVIKFAVIAEARDAVELTEVLRTSTFATCLFKIGMLCYDRDDFLSFLKTDVTGELAFLGDKKNSFDRIIDGAYVMYSLVLFDGGFKAEVRHGTTILPPSSLESSTKVELKGCESEVVEQIRRDMAAAFGVVAVKNYRAINDPHSVIRVCICGELHTVLDGGSEEEKSTNTNPVHPTTKSKGCCVM